MICRDAHWASVGDAANNIKPYAGAGVPDRPNKYQYFSTGAHCAPLQNQGARYYRAPFDLLHSYHKAYALSRLVENVYLEFMLVNYRFGDRKS